MMLNSFKHDVPSVYARFAISCCSRSLSVFWARAVSTPVARVPSSLRESRAATILPIAAPFDPMPSSIRIRASFISSAISFLKSLTLIFAAAAKASVRRYIPVITWDMDVPATSIVCPRSSSVAPRPAMLERDIFAEWPTPPTRRMNSTMFASLAVEALPSSFTAAAVFIIPSSMPNSSFIWNTFTSFPIWPIVVSTLSPRSLPSDIFMMSAARVNPSMSFLAMPSFPPMRARARSSFCAVRVSILASMAFNSSTSSRVMPVVLRAFDIASSSPE